MIQASAGLRVREPLFFFSGLGKIEVINSERCSVEKDKQRGPHVMKIM
jgi:hypothetical protein